MTLPILDLSQTKDRKVWAERLDRLRATASLVSPEATTVSSLIEDVRNRGDRAVVEAMQKFTDPDFQMDRIRVQPDEMKRAETHLDPAIRKAMERAIENVRLYQDHICPTNPNNIEIAGAEVGLRFTPVASAGLLVPGGVAVLVSTLIMLAVPALAAGVRPGALSVVHPPPTRRGSTAGGDISPEVMACCHMLGIDTLYRIGGAQAVAALAFGTDQGKVLLYQMNHFFR